jgi:hypothetical protein
MSIRFTGKTLLIIAITICTHTIAKSQCASIPNSLGGSGTFCLDAPMFIGIPETAPDQTYTWYRNGVAVKGPKQGSGNAESLEFALRSSTETGNYKVITIKPGCAPTEFGNVTVALTGPARQKLNGGVICNYGVDEVNLILGGSQVGVVYQLHYYGSPIGAPINGTGGPLNFGAVTETGEYEVRGNGMGCTSAWIDGIEILQSVRQAEFTEGFNTAGNTVYPNCWSLGSPVTGSSAFSFVTSSTNPSTTPYEGSRYVFWNSAVFPNNDESRLLTVAVTPPVGITTLDIEFYWYNNNNPSFSTGAFLNEGVQVQAFIGGNWTNVGTFVPRHDGTLAANTGQWKKKTITVNNVSPGTTVYSFKFHSSHGNNCAMDAVTFKPTPGCQRADGLGLLALSGTSATLGWNPLPNVTNYQYAITQSSSAPVTWSTTSSTQVVANSLLPATKYYLHVRTECSAGLMNWSSYSFYSAQNCAAAPSVTACTNFTVNTSGYNGGIWNFDDAYPNGFGYQTQAHEALDDVGGNSSVYALYKPASYGCTDSGWTAIIRTDNFKSGIGVLQAGTEYYFVFDGEFDNSTFNATYKICKAIPGAPSSYNTCIPITSYQTIPANCPKMEYLIDNAGRLVGSLDFSGNNYDAYGFNISYFVRSGTVRRDNNNVEYFDRNYFFTENYNGAVKFKAYFPNTELDRIINEPNDGNADIASVSDLLVTFSNGNVFFNGGVRALNYSCPPDAYTIPSSEYFSVSGKYLLPDCWTEQQFGSRVSFEMATPHPLTGPLDGSRYVFYNSYSFPAGTSTILTAPKFSTIGTANVDLEFYWYNNNNPSYTSNIEGVQVEYSLDGNAWTWLNFIQRHDPTLPENTGQWKKKKLQLPVAFGNKAAVYIRFIFFSQYGDNCAMDFVKLAPRAACTDVVNLATTNITHNSVSFNWSAVPGVTSYQVAATTSPLPPCCDFYTTTVNGTSTTLNNLQDQTDYYIHIRPVCSPGNPGGWTTITFRTTINCTSIPSMPECSSILFNFAAGTGQWSLTGAYPNNSMGYPTPGKEKMFSYTPTQTGVYYLEVMSNTGGYIDYFYKQSTGDCVPVNWIPIVDAGALGKWAIGLLQAGQTYVFLGDPENTAGISQTVRVCRAETTVPPLLNTCLDIPSHPKTIPAGSTREEYIIDGLGNLIAALDFSNTTNSVGNFQVLYNVNSNAIRRGTGNKEYLDRNFTITTTNAPVGPVGVKLFFTTADLTRLINEPNDGIADVSTIANLNGTRIQQGCSNTITEGASAILPQVANGSYDAGSSFVKFNSYGLGTFFVHGGLVPINQDANTVRICPGGNTSIAIPSAGAGFTYQWQVNTGSGFSNISNNVNYAGVTTTSLHILNPPTTWYGYQYRCVATNGSSTNSTPVTLKFAVIWNGIQDNTWEAPGNWNCGVLPDANTDVIISPAVVNLPAISSNQAVRSLEAKSGSTITVNSGFRLEIRN